MSEHRTQQPHPGAAPMPALPPRTRERRVWAAQRDLVRESLVRFPERADRRHRR